MKTSGNTVLITGGATGIGLALAEAFWKAGNKVLICGRRVERLEEAKAKLPGLQTKVCDVSDPSQRLELFEWTTKNFPDTNVLVNNAGIQRMVDFKKGGEAFAGYEEEIETNLTAPLHLIYLFIPHLAQKKEAAIVNVSSGLGFIPLAILPVYCATKAALHSFSMSLRHQLRQTSIKVFEIIPPTTDTELDHGRRRASYRGIPAVDVAVAALQAIEKDEPESAVGEAQGLRMAAWTDPEGRFKEMNSW